MPPERHDRDAGGDPEVLERKADLRDRIRSALEEPPRRASSIKGASRSGVTVDVSELQPVDLVVTGCVATSPDGRRLGKGGCC